MDAGRAVYAGLPEFSGELPAVTLAEDRHRRATGRFEVS